MRRWPAAGWRALGALSTLSLPLARRPSVRTWRAELAGQAFSALLCGSATLRPPGHSAARLPGCPTARLLGCSTVRAHRVPTGGQTASSATGSRLAQAPAACARLLISASGQRSPSVTSDGWPPAGPACVPHFHRAPRTGRLQITLARETAAGCPKARSPSSYLARYHSKPLWPQTHPANCSANKARSGLMSSLGAERGCVASSCVRAWPRPHSRRPAMQPTPVALGLARSSSREQRAESSELGAQISESAERDI